MTLMIATMPDGHTRTRTTKFDELWLVTARRSYDYALADAKTGERHGARYRELMRPAYDDHPAYRDSMLEGATTEAEYVAARVAEDIESVECLRADGHYDAYCPIRWARARAEAKGPVDPGWCDVTVVQAVPVPRPINTRLADAVAANPEVDPALAAAWERGVRYAFSVAYNWTTKR